MNILKKHKRPTVCIIGHGWWGRGLKRMLRMQNYNIIVFTSKTALTDLLKVECDLVFECTGDPEICRAVAEMCLLIKVNLMTVNSEFDCHWGFFYDKLFKSQNLVYCGCAGDQPGCIYKLAGEVKFMGFSIIVAGTCKGFIDKYQTPKGVTKWCKAGHNPDKICSFADGTKLNIEAAVMCNVLNLVPDVRGMHGLNCTKDELLEAFPRVINTEGVVDYTLGVKGINQEAGVFVIGKLKNNNQAFRDDLQYLKLGAGPYYLFFRDYHLCYFEAAESVVKLVELGIPYYTSSHMNADVSAVAKRDIKQGTELGGIGSADIYGEIDTVKRMADNKQLSVVECKGQVLHRDILKDEPITEDMICM